MSQLVEKSFQMTVKTSHNAKDKKMLLHAEGCPLEYTTDISVPENTPSEFAPFYEKRQRFAAFTFVVPAGQSVSVKTRLERL